MGIKSSVSLYSLQYQYLRGNMDLEQIVDYVMGLGADGIELLPDQMLKGTPTPSEETYAAWDKIIEKHHPGLACDDIFLNTNLYSNRTLTKRECVDLIKKEIVMAHRLGFKVIRLVSMVLHGSLSHVWKQLKIRCLPLYRDPRRTRFRCSENRGIPGGNDSSGLPVHRYRS